MKKKIIGLLTIVSLLTGCGVNYDLVIENEDNATLTATIQYSEPEYESLQSMVDDLSDLKKVTLPDGTIVYEQSEMKTGSLKEIMNTEEDFSGFEYCVKSNYAYISNPFTNSQTLDSHDSDYITFTMCITYPFIVEQANGEIIDSNKVKYTVESAGDDHFLYAYSTGFSKGIQPEFKPKLKISGVKSGKTYKSSRDIHIVSNEKFNINIKYKKKDYAGSDNVSEFDITLGDKGSYTVIIDTVSGKHKVIKFKIK